LYEYLAFSEQIITAQDIADALGVTRSTVNRWARTNKIPSFRTPQGRLRFDSAIVKNAIMKTQDIHGL
jgi:excisionase family DNA binding protein